MTLNCSIFERLKQDIDRLALSVSGEIHPDDGMFRGNMQHYQSCGSDALLNVALAMASAGMSRPARVLDFACGFGRVARYLRVAFPDAEFTFTDVMPTASAFCAATFGGADAPISRDFSSYAPGCHDLIWVGSLFTHLPEGKSTALINLLFELTSPGGVIVFTSHGRDVRARRNKGTWPYAIDAGQFDAMISLMDSQGYGFVGYKGSTDYGISLASLGWWDRTLNTIQNSEIVMVRERGWDRHQDVIAIKRLA